MQKKKEYRGLLKKYYKEPIPRHDWFNDETGKGLKH
jgi:hypothetical protein